MNNKVNKNEFIERIAKKNDMNAIVVRETYDAIVDEILDVLCEGNSLSLTGFGVFSLKKHKGHPVQFEAQNDKVDDYVVMKFAASDVLMNKIRSKMN